MLNLAFSIYDLEYFLLILVRVSCFVYICPFFSMKNTPRRIRVALSVFIAGLIYTSLTPIEPVIYDSVVTYAVIVLKEGIAGLLIGLSANIC
ncbi:MAG: flagellar biosynthetic protein FliR, partial [Lachnospiraceae bacterium]|nr:flagellar biosynthetic protein FliR [Lachnospiraceae bacterium]